ncbi:sulfurtransferase [Undibacterium oligocarboniphilum]|uniref:Sulfurtransferase n=1 Tax=Undibacterium oligocarboniphilum TaxID=666702 RepID=A0A850QDP8_9BURK|nr:sulfurtransferase [Undibacterium oligocarboniphilum]MBC3870617.1 sulfurtransferase [Undibacterium oligocarboniphilum]NVO78582.1 sulfurtransferase [Undibacterium oligocarboniphilum]
MWTTLISVADLVRHQQDRNQVILDCRHDLGNPQAGREAYAQGHLPGALFVHLDEQLSACSRDHDGIFRGRHPLPDQQTFIQTLRSLGISDDTQVIAYDAHGGMFAARLWWMLRWVGHEAVAVLDGGITAWTAAGLPLSTDLSIPSAGTISQHPPLTVQVSIGDVLENLSSAAMTLVDARAADRYRGENETIDPVGGHIPGALNRFFKDNLQPDGTFKSPLQLSQEWSQLVADPARAIMQCGSGVTACHNLLALEVAGLCGAALYPGSWSEWCADPARPVAR